MKGRSRGSFVYRGFNPLLAKSDVSMTAARRAYLLICNELGKIKK